MKFEMTRDERVSGNELVVLHVRGELDIDCAPTLQEDIKTIIEPDCKHLLLEIDGLRHIDSFSLGTFLGIRQRMRARGGTVSLVCHNSATRRLFRITNLEKLFPFHESVETFLAEHGGPLSAENVSP
jgi:anti-sigma B factor antagonist